jgi:hypothetical protein
MSPATQRLVQDASAHLAAGLVVIAEDPLTWIQLGPGQALKLLDWLTTHKRTLQRAAKRR